jgi:hypothetical protein
MQTRLERSKRDKVKSVNNYIHENIKHDFKISTIISSFPNLTFNRMYDTADSEKMQRIFRRICEVGGK